MSGVLAIGRESLLADLHIEPLEKNSQATVIRAVDGGSRVLFDLPGIVIGAYRVSSVEWTPFQLKDIQGDMVVESITKGDQKELLSVMGYGEDKESWEAAALAVGLRRKMLEWETIYNCVKEVSSGGTVLVDGSLDPVLAPVKEISEMALEMGKERGVNVVGVSKSSDLSSHGLPYLPLLEWKAITQGVDSSWISTIRHSKQFSTYIVKFAQHSNHVFRVDVSKDGSTEAVASLCDLCNDAGYPGYPYPLARAHNISVIDGNTARDLKFELECMLAGDESVFWKCLSRNFHKVLDGGVL